MPIPGTVQRTAHPRRAVRPTTITNRPPVVSSGQQRRHLARGTGGGPGDADAGRWRAIATLITGRPTCIDCIATQAQMTVDEARELIAHISRAVTLYGGTGERCRSCGETKATYSVERPA